MIHLAAAIRDQPHARVEELNGLATARLLRAAERPASERFVFFSAIGATEFQRTRFFRAKALAERAVLRLRARDDRLRALDRLRPRRPLGDDDAPPGAAAVIPISGEGGPRLPADLGRRRRPLRDRRSRRRRPRRIAAARARRPGALTYDQIARLIARVRRSRPPAGPRPARARALGLAGLRRLVGDAAFATWEEAELMEVPMVVRAWDRRRRGARGRAAADGRGARGVIDGSGAPDDATLVDGGSRARAARVVKSIALWLGEASTYGRLWTGLALLIRFVSPGARRPGNRPNDGRRCSPRGSHRMRSSSPLVDRTRPADREETGPGSGADEDSSSFPSSHTATGAAFAVSAYRCDRIVGLAMTPVAGLVGYSRVLTDAHHTSDVLAGRAIGAVVGFYVGGAR